MKQQIKFLKSPTGMFNLGYFAGDVAEFEEEQANILIEAGLAQIPVKKGEGLPDDIPGRDKLIKAGFDKTEDLKNIEDFTQINGIGKKLAEELTKYFGDK